MKWRDLIVDAGTGMVSHTKLWANVCYAACTAAFGWQVYHNTATDMIWLIYLGCVGTSATASKWLSMKYGVKPTRENANG
ncbi:MAG: hypothetical protein ACOY4U_00065 [Pseudomonadota bacterium]